MINMLEGHLITFPRDCYIVLARNGTKGGYVWKIAKDQEELEHLIESLKRVKKKIVVLRARPLVKYVRIKRKGMEIWREYTEFRRPQHEKG